MEKVEVNLLLLKIEDHMEQAESSLDDFVYHQREVMKSLLNLQKGFEQWKNERQNSTA